MRTPRHRTVGPVLLLALLAAGGSARAQDLGSFPFDRFSLIAGSFYETTDTNLRLDAASRAGTSISLESDLGLDDSDQLLRLGAEWRPFERHQFAAAYYKLSREGSRVIDRDIDFGGVTFPARGSVGAKADFEFLELVYTLWAVKKPRGGLGLSLGASQIGIDTTLNAQLAVPGGGGMVSRERSASTDLPVPLLGAEGRYAFARRFLIAGSVRLLPKVNIENYEGKVLTYGARLEWRLARHLGLGASWDSFNIDADVDKDRFRGSLDFTVEGAQAYLRLAF